MRLTLRLGANRLRKWPLGLLGLLLAASAGCQGAPVETTPTPIPTAIVPVKPTYTVEQGEVIKSVTFSGRVTPVVQQSLFFSTSGRVAEVLAAVDDQVTAGQVLATLENGPSDYALRRAEIHLELAQLALDYARAQPESAQQAYDMAVKTYEVELAQIALDELTASVAGSQLVAPFDGRLLQVSLAKGGSVEAFQPVALLVTLDTLEVSADLFGEDLQQLTEGLPVSAQLASRPSEALHGTIRQLPYPYGSGAAGAEGELTRVALEPGTEPLELGELVRMTAVVDQRTGVLWLPPQAIRRFDGRTFAVVQDGQAQRRVDIELGLEGDDRVEIVSGLTAGEIVVAP
jgi:RND family efflux transporter MFP subunit